MGTPTSVVPVLHRLHGMADVDLVAAVTPPDRPRGRGRQAEPPPVKQAAEPLRIPVLQPSSLRNESVQAELADLAPDVIVVAAYGRLLPTPVLNLPAHDCLNLHPSLLPRHRGPSPVATAILEGDEATGVSLMLLDEGMDTGPVIAQKEYAFTGRETAGDLTDSLFAIGAELLADNLEVWTRGELQTKPQDDAIATISRKLERADGQADWTLPAETLARQCRAFAPWPGLYTHWDGKTLKLLETQVVADGSPGEAEPGRVVAHGSTASPCVATCQGMLSLNRVQLEGRRAVTGNEFLRGYPEILNSVLGNTEQK